MNKSRRKKFSPEIKAQILSKLQVPGCSVPELSKAYNISRTTIYTWQQKSLDISTNHKLLKTPNFVEVSVSNITKPTLEKASLIFKDFSLVIEGKISSASLINIMQILEQQSC